MTERREPTISAYSPSKEELARQQSVKRGARQASQGRSASNSPAAKPLTTSSPTAPIALVVALIACCAAGGLYWQLANAQQSLAAAQQLLVESDRRIADLESKFELSDDEVTASTETIQAKLKWADSEIRKLWGVSYDTNRKAIAANKKAAEQAAQTANATSRAVDGKITAATQSISTDLKLVSDLVDAQQSSMTSIEQGSAQIVRQQQNLADQINGLDSARKAFEQRIKRNEQAIEAIDAFRRSTNQKLLELKGGA